MRGTHALLLLSLVLPSPACLHAPASPAGPGVGAAAWETLSRGLPGTWQRPAASGPFTVTYRLVSGGSALVEVWGAGGGHETLTVLAPDHDALLLTHYCAQGNQPRLRAERTVDGGAAFVLMDATNVLPGQALLVERALRVQGDTLEVSEGYRQPDGGIERTTTQLRRAPGTSSL